MNHARACFLANCHLFVMFVGYNPVMSTTPETAHEPPQRRIDAQTINGLGYNPYRSHETHPDDPNVIATDLAKEFITILEEAIAKKGYSVLMAAEQEVDITYDELTKPEQFNEREKAVRRINQRIDSISVNDASRLTINKAYLDDGVEICTKPATPSTSARRIEQWQRLLASGKSVDAEKPFIANFSPITNFQYLMGEVDARKLGLHVNISLHKGAGLNESEMLSGRYNITHSSTFDGILRPVLLRAGVHDRLMMFNSSDSLLRWELVSKEIVHSKSHIKDSEGGDIKEMRRSLARVENRVPDAACNPYLAILANLAAVYYAIDVAERSGEPLDAESEKSGAALQSIKDTLENDYPKDGEGHDLTMDVIRTDFIENSLTINVLNDVFKKRAASPENFQKLDRFKQTIIDRSSLMERQQTAIERQKHSAR